MGIEIKNVAKAISNVGMKVVNATIVRHPVLTVTAVIGGIVVYKTVKAVNNLKRSIENAYENIDMNEVMKTANAMASAVEKMAEHEEVFEEIERAVEETFDDGLMEKVEKAVEEVETAEASTNTIAATDFINTK